MEVEVHVLNVVGHGQGGKHNSSWLVEGSFWSRPVRKSNEICLRFSSLSDPSSFSVRVQRGKKTLLSGVADSQIALLGL